jgi:xylulose-5-phosphate/fructose-6-phosphate phosphoketolase
MSEQKSKEENNISPFGLARSTVKEQPLSKEELDKYTRYFNATLYICLG